VRTEALGFVRTSAEDPRVIEGVAVPYGVVSRPTELLPGSGEIVREAWAPASFARDVAEWSARPDGRRMPFRPRHGEKPVGSVIALRDAADGVHFTARIREGARGDEYLADVADGINGVSVEGMWNEPPRRLKDGTVLHRSGRLHGIAGSDNPAYDGAHIALRDMEDSMDCPTCGAAMTAGVAHTCATQTTPPAPVVERDAASTTATPAAAQRDAIRADALVQAATRSPITISRDALIYGREAASLPDGSHPSYFADGWAASQGDRDAADRQHRYNLATSDLMRQMERDALVALRAGDVVSSEIPGAYPNEYLPGLLTPRILKGRPMGGFYQRVPVADATPKIFPKVTTSTTVAVQAAEGTNPAASDFATTAVTVTPLLYGAETVVSRQTLDGSNPTAEAMLMQDLMEAYAQASELVIVTAVEAGSSASGTAITAATPYAGTQGNVIKYATTRFRSATGQFVPSALFAVLASENDTTGRPKLPAVGPINSDGTKQGVLGYNLLGAQGQMSYQSTVNVVVTGVESDHAIFESPIARFSYDAVTGPAGVRVGIWAYLVVGTRLGSLKVTAA
jgi:hypothetical protein